MTDFDALVRQRRSVRGVTPDPELGILLGVAFGYVVAEAPANATRTVRAALAESVQFIGAG